MISKDDIVKTLFNAIDLLNQQRPDDEQLDKSLDLTLFGEKGSLDSLGLVAFLVAVEDQIEDDFNARLDLGDSGFTATDDNPLTSVSDLADRIVSLLDGQQPVPPKKVVFVDLDNVMWEGIVGDDGWQELKIYGEYEKLQNDLKQLSHKGILLAIASKNEENIALEALENHQDMILKPSDFIVRRINWRDKASNIRDMLGELNIGAEAAVFIDDSPFERDNVESFMPEITVTEELDLGLFDTASLTQEDVHRLQMYKVEKERQNIKNEAGSFNEWLKTLKISLRVDSLNESNLPRATQLLNKTNQMNLRTRRMTEQEFYSWSQENNNHVRVFWVADKFGESGLTAIVSLTVNGDQAEIVDFVMSCRIMGREIERSLVSFTADLASSLGAKEISAHYLETKKNKPCLDFWLNSSFNYDQTNKAFSWPLNNEYMPAPHITLEEQDA